MKKANRVMLCTAVTPLVAGSLVAGHSLDALGLRGPHASGTGGAVTAFLFVSETHRAFWRRSFGQE